MKLLPLVFALLAHTACAAPFVPARGSDVVETLPGSADPARHALRRMRAQLTATPHNLALATDLARRYIGIARSETDPRFHGYAQAALAPWWSLPDPPPEVRLLRATLLQSNHHFPAALADLDAIVGADPANAQAWLTRATVQTVRGDYAAARASCTRLASLADQLVSLACLANVASLTGNALASEQLLDASLRRSGADSAMQSWVLTLLAEMAERRGDAAAAEARFRRALAFAPRDSYLIGAYADFLLARSRPRDVIPLVRDHARIDGLLLRHALALRQLPGSEKAARDAVEELRARFAAAAQRGDSAHQREQARFELHLRGDAAAALALARQNWAVQKEPADTRIYLEAALKAGDRHAAAPVLAWLRQHRSEDVTALRLAGALKGGA